MVLEYTLYKQYIVAPLDRKPEIKHLIDVGSVENGQPWAMQLLPDVHIPQLSSSSVTQPHLPTSLHTHAHTPPIYIPHGSCGK